MFNLSSDVTVTSLGYFDLSGHGLVDSHDVGIYDAGGDLLVSTTVLPSDPKTDGFVFRPISPLVLEAGSGYRIAAMPTTGDPWGYNPATFTSNSPVTYLGDAIHLYTPTLVFPDGADGAFAYFGPNFTFNQGVPEPATVTLVLLGLAGAAMVRRVRRGRARDLLQLVR